MKQLSFDGKTKEDLAIEFIRKHEPPEGYFLGFSGGKDSIVLYDLTVKSGVKFSAFYSKTGIDPPEVVSFIARNYPEVKHLPPTPYKGAKSFFGMIRTQRCPPKRLRRWC